MLFRSVTEEGARVAARSQRIVDGVHEAALGSLPPDARAALVKALNALVSGHLATPSENAAPAARRIRERNK